MSEVLLRSADVQRLTHPDVHDRSITTLAGSSPLQLLEFAETLL